MTEMTQLPQAAQSGDARPSNALFQSLYADLKHLAHARLYRCGSGAVELDTTSLVHESFLRLSKNQRLDDLDRGAFFGYVGQVMRNVIIDHVRSQQAHKRGGDQVRVTLTTGVADATFDGDQLLAMDTALDALQRVAPRFHELVELRYFAGLSVREVAELRKVSTRTVEREWDKARAFLRRLMREQ